MFELIQPRHKCTFSRAFKQVKAKKPILKSKVFFNLYDPTIHSQKYASLLFIILQTFNFAMLFYHMMSRL